MEIKKKTGKKLALFFSFRISLKVWHDLGLLDRNAKLYNELSEYFEKIYFFTYGGKEDKKLNKYLSSNIEIIPVPYIRYGGRKKILRPLLLVYSILLPFIHWKILKDTDILKTNEISGSWTALIAKLIFGKKLVLRHDYIWSYFQMRDGNHPVKVYIVKLIEKVVGTFADEVICSSLLDREYFKKNYNVESRIIIDYVDTEVFKPRTVPKIKSSICFVGRLEKQKNLHALLEALKGSSYKLTIIGSGSMREELEKKVRENNINVDFIKNIPNSKLPDVLNQHEIFILPSLYEGTPKVLLEGMACLPVIGTNVTGIKETIKHKENGYLCETDAESIRKAIIEVLENKPLREKIAQNGRKTILEKCSLDKILEKELKIYSDLNGKQEIDKNRK